MRIRSRRGFTPALFACLLILPLVWASCGGDSTSQQDALLDGTPQQSGILTSNAEACSEQERVAAPAVTPEEITSLVRGDSDFAFDLYRLLSEGDENLFFSPHSISVALAMAYAGACGDTEREMAAALSFLLPQERLHPAFNALDLALTDPGRVATEETGEAFQFNIVNALWGQDGYQFLPPFLDTLAENYGAGMRLVDFQRDWEGAREMINAWVADQTEERITELLPQGIIDAATRLVLTNAIYFKASWLFPFPRENTADGPFRLLDGSTVQTPMMKLDARTLYGEVDGVQAVELPYTGFQYSAYVVVPAEGEFEEFERTLNAEAVEAILDSLGDAQVKLTMPKFEFESSSNLNETLKALGMPLAFNPEKADFSGMDGTRGLSIADVVHKAFVSVDEEGTEAAAATAVVMHTSLPPPAELVVDRPFLFLIRHNQTGTILFVGRVLDPTA